jgi:hypothetical protein
MIELEVKGLQCVFEQRLHLVQRAVLVVLLAELFNGIADVVTDVLQIGLEQLSGTVTMRLLPITPAICIRMENGP